MASLFATYLWPPTCPRCRSKLSTLDRILLQMRRVASVVAFAGGKKAPSSRDLRRCEWCGNA